MATGTHNELFKAVCAATGSSKKAFNSNHYNIRAAPQGDAWLQVLVKESTVWFGLAIDPADAAEARNSKMKYEAALSDLRKTQPDWDIWAPAARPHVWYVMRKIGPVSTPAATLAASIAATCTDLEGALANDEILEL
ncbi:MAG: hypothetical protein NTW19_04810 [Planctomycetota bacterium]|nr:hypothetical protein [Planctomycetota bacterium]